MVTLLIICSSSFSWARLEYDSTANKVQLYGPYIKFNVLKPPYSFGRYQFELTDIDLEVVKRLELEPQEPLTPIEENRTDDTEQKETEVSKKKQKQQSPQSQEDIQIFVKWPRFLLSFGRLRLINEKQRVLVNIRFTEDMVGSDEKYARLLLNGEDDSLMSALDEKFQICVDQKFEASYVKACSDFLIYKDGKLQRVFSGKNAAAAVLNGRKVPKNAQISLDAGMKNVSVSLRFKSGFMIFAKDKVHILELENVAIDPQEKRLGIISGDGSVRPTRLTLKDKFFGFIKEKNYFKNEYANTKDWPQNLDDAEMEFAPYQTGASSQLYGLILPNVPPPFKFELNDNNPIATYTNEVDLNGTKVESEVLAAKQRNELFIHANNKEFLWKFPTPNTGEVNKNYLSLQHKDKNYFFSQRIFRAHHSAFSGALALSTSPTLDIVPGYNFWAEHWFEQLWNKSKYSYQRWGVQANIYETIQGFKPNKNFPEKISVLPANFDILFRLKSGVRPVQSSFGLGVRYLDFKLYRSISSNIETRMLGIGAFWQTAPQKIIDDIFNVVPFFRYPKWLEVSCYYYPLLLGPEQIGFSFSWQARGRMFFRKRWFLDASFNVNAISFKKSKISGVTNGADAFNIGTAHGTIGLGFFFN